MRSWSNLPGEVEQVIKLVGRNPGCYPPKARLWHCPAGKELVSYPSFAHPLSWGGAFEFTSA